MTWKANLKKMPRGTGQERIRYADLPDGSIRLFVFVPSGKNVLELLFTSVYPSILVAQARWTADYHALSDALVEPDSAAPADAPRCAFEKCQQTFVRSNPRQRYCSDRCKHRADSLKTYYRRKARGDVSA